MDWDAIGAIGEIVGASAVVVSLIYLATQIRQNTKVARSTMRHGITNSAMVGGQIMAENQYISPIMFRHNNGEELAGDEYLRLQAFAYMTTRNWENIHYQYLSGMLTQEEWLAFRQNLKALYQNEIWQDYWRREQDIYTEAFRNEIDNILSEINSGERAAETSVIFPDKENDRS
jgi:hypothetical protein